MRISARVDFGQRLMGGKRDDEDVAFGKAAAGEFVADGEGIVDAGRVGHDGRNGEITGRKKMSADWVIAA